MASYYCSAPDCRKRWRTFKCRSRRDTVKCRSCGAQAQRVRRLKPGISIGTIPDIPEHFNWSFGKVVKSRAHLKELQIQHGCQDYEPVRGSAGHELVRENMRRERRKVFVA